MKKILYIIGIGVTGMFLLGSCGSHTDKEEAHDHEGCSHTTGEHRHDEHEEQKEDGDDEIVLSKEQAQAAGIQSEAVEAGTFRQVIKTGGQVLAAQGGEATAVATIAGVVSLGNRIVEGTEVSRGATLLTLSAKNMAEGDPVQRAQVIYDAARKEYERMKPLAASRIVSQKEFSQAEENYQKARIVYEATAKNSSGGGQAVAAPVSGFVKSILVKEGDYVEAGQPVAVVTQSRRLFLRAEVPEKYYRYLRTIASANFKTPYGSTAYSLEELGGKLLSYGKSSGDNSYYTPVTFEFDNKGDVLPGSFVEIYLLSSPMSRTISLPHTALTEEQGLYFVYLQTDDDCYRKQEVTLGADNGQRVQILSGIASGDRVVTRGAYQVKLASTSSTIPSHNHEH
ncbi:MAG: efflux RND transporter periplasmic adaptor subunit [Mediterranea sp.]|nr:efflux RND transporter periplasmic adaptor subunit [Mediterranea sp.]